MTEYNFSGLTDVDLMVLQKEMRKYPEDKEFLGAILKELGKRHRRHLSEKQEVSNAE